MSPHSRKRKHANGSTIIVADFTREKEVYFPSDGANTIKCTNRSSQAQSMLNRPT